MVDLCLQISSDFKYYFVVEEIFELRLTTKLDVSTLRKYSYSDSGVNSQKFSQV